MPEIRNTYTYFIIFAIIAGLLTIKICHAAYAAYDLSSYAVTTSV